MGRYIADTCRHCCYEYSEEKRIKNRIFGFKKIQLMDLPWHLQMMAVMFIVAGLNHFLHPKIYLRIIPQYVPYPKMVNYISGFAEILFGFLLFFSSTLVCAAWAIIALLIAFFPTHLYMLTNKKASFGLPVWLLLLRLPLQLALIFWAYQYTL